MPPRGGRQLLARRSRWCWPLTRLRSTQNGRSRVGSPSARTCPRGLEITTVLCSPSSWARSAEGTPIIPSASAPDPHRLRVSYRRVPVAFCVRSADRDGRRLAEQMPTRLAVAASSVSVVSGSGRVLWRAAGKRRPATPCWGFHHPLASWTGLAGPSWPRQVTSPGNGRADASWLATVAVAPFGRAMCHCAGITCSGVHRPVGRSR